jgi:LAGLIDADG DNA endonuclease family
MTDLIIKKYILKTLKLNNYKKDYRLMTNLPKYLNDTLIGLLLSDGGLERPTEGSNVRLSVIMSIINYGYALHLYNLFEPYINSDLKTLDIKGSNKLSKKMYSTVIFKTISTPQLLYYYNIFYKKIIITDKWQKIVPLELKSSFNAVSLAHLIMGDGNYLSSRNIIRIYTNSFTENDVLLLSNIINDNLNIKNKVIHDRNNQYIIIIEQDSIVKTREILLPYMHPSMLYKLGIDTNSIIPHKFDYFNIINQI